jgi:hypothetical protein
MQDGSCRAVGAGMFGIAIVERNAGWSRGHQSGEQGAIYRTTYDVTVGRWPVSLEDLSPM